MASMCLRLPASTVRQHTLLLEMLTPQDSSSQRCSFQSKQMKEAPMCSRTCLAEAENTAFNNKESHHGGTAQRATASRHSVVRHSSVRVLPGGQAVQTAAPMSLYCPGPQGLVDGAVEPIGHA